MESCSRYLDGHLAAVALRRIARRRRATLWRRRRPAPGRTRRWRRPAAAGRRSEPGRRPAWRATASRRSPGFWFPRYGLGEAALAAGLTTAGKFTKSGEAAPAADSLAISSRSVCRFMALRWPRVTLKVLAHCRSISQIEVNTTRSHLGETYSLG